MNGARFISNGLYRFLGNIIIEDINVPSALIYATQVIVDPRFADVTIYFCFCPQVPIFRNLFNDTSDTVVLITL